MAHVLLIEPDRALARTYIQALEHVGHEVAHVTSAQGAVEAADKKRPDVVVLELQIAAHNGIEFLHEFRSYAEWQQIPVIVNTQLVPHVVAPLQPILGRDLGVQACLYKPRTSLGRLLETVNQVTAI